MPYHYLIHDEAFEKVFVGGKGSKKRGHKQEVSTTEKGKLLKLICGRN